MLSDPSMCPNFNINIIKIIIIVIIKKNKLLEIDIFINNKKDI